MIIAIPSAPGRRARRRWFAPAASATSRCARCPGVFELISGSVNLMRQVREVRVEDVLGREPVPFEIEQAGA